VVHLIAGPSIRGPLLRRGAVLDLAAAGRLLTLSFLAKTVLEPSIKAEYSVTIWWIWVLTSPGDLLRLPGIVLSEKALIITGTIEILIMVAWRSPGSRTRPRRVQLAPLNPGNFGLATNLFLGVVFSIFAFSGWESTARWLRRARTPRCAHRPGGSVIILMIYFVLVTWGYLVGIGVNKVAGIPTASAFPVATLAQRVWGSAWVFLLFALLNSAIAVSIACFNGGTRTWYAMGRSGVLPSALGKVNPAKKTPVNAINLEVAVQVIAFACILIWGVENVLAWANTIPSGWCGTSCQHQRDEVPWQGPGQFNVLLHVIIPVVASAAGSSWCGSPTSRRSPAPGPSTGACWCSARCW
jgi:amino acid transporter